MASDESADGNVEKKVEELRTTIVARPANWHRGKIIAVAVMFIGFGAWFAYDGFYKWPKENRDIQPGQKPPHNDLSIQMQKVLAFVCPALGLWMITRAIRRSRGEYRLEGDVLHVHGHPPVPLDAITRIDKQRWEKKGIALIDYELAGGGKGTVTLDDFYYDRESTDRIFERITAYARGQAG